MADWGYVEPFDLAIFSDTGWEPAAVYDWLAYLQSVTKTKIIVTKDENHPGGVRERFWEMPVFVKNTDTGKRGMSHRSCTNRFKIQPVRREIRRQLGVGPRDRIAPGTVTQAFGISWDESQRMSDSDVKFVVHEYPLIDRKMTRVHCQRWLIRHGYPRAPRSACIGCPYHSDAEWGLMKAEHPDEFADAAALDAHMRATPDRGGLTHDPYLHRSLIPLSEVQFTNDDEPNGDCRGFCKT